MAEIRKMTVFVASVSKEMEKYKENLEKELKYHNYIVKSITSTDNGPDDIREIVEACDFSIHILSESNTINSEHGKGIEESQIHIAMQKQLSQKLVAQSTEIGFKIFAWHPKPFFSNVYVDEKLPVHLLKIQQLEEVEFLQTNYEDFKYHLFNTIEADRAEDLNEFYIKGSDNLSIYLLYDVQDKQNAIEYIDYLTKRGFTILTPEFDGNIIEIRHQHNLHLKRYDVAIIFAKEAKNNWVNMKIVDILKSPGMGRVKPIKTKALIITNEIKKHLPPTVRGFDIVPVDELSPKDQLDIILQKVNL
jgi:hypothetical protein